MAKPIYLDFAAATPIDDAVIDVMQPFYASNFYNPSALYIAAKQVRKEVDKARSTVAEQLGVRPGEIIFTAGGTEANNLAVQGIMQQFPTANVVVSAIEHDSVLKPAARFACNVAKVTEDGQVDITLLTNLIDEQTVLVSIMYANNEIGTIQPISTIANTLKDLRKRRKNSGNDLPLYLHTDACQAVQYLDVHAARLGVDLMTLNGGKIYGPKQSGALYVRAGVKLIPAVHGGGQEFGLRSGTENVPQVIGFAKAVEICGTKKAKELVRMRELQKLFVFELESKLPKAQLTCSLRHRLPNNVHVMIPGIDNERIVMMLDEAGIQTAAGSACSASNDEPSHVLRAIGFSEQEAQASIRFTMGRQTSESDVRTAVDMLAACIV